MPTKEILTIGYEGLGLAAFTGALSKARVSVLADIRAIAHSRRPGFAKVALRSAVEAAGIQYVHIPALGNPKAGRIAAWSGDTDEYKRIFHAHLTLPTARLAMEQLIVAMKARRTCLMCMEADPAECHRSIVAATVERISGLHVKHLRPIPWEDRDGA